MNVHGSVPELRVAELTKRFGSLTTLQRALAALDGERLQFTDAIAMDEYSIDILVDLPDGLTLVFDTT